MTESQTEQTPIQQVQTEGKALEQAFERFVRFSDPAAVAELDLETTIALQRELAEVRTSCLGKKSAWATKKKLIGRVAPSERPVVGQLVQEIEDKILTMADTIELNLKAHIHQERTARESIDVTLPGRRPAYGHRHPITIVRERIEDIFVALGYVIEDGREIETDFYNFTALNIPDNHPARGEAFPSLFPSNAPS